MLPRFSTVTCLRFFPLTTPDCGYMISGSTLRIQQYGKSTHLRCILNLGNEI